MPCQLEYAQDTEGDFEAILISLLHSYGVKAQETLAEWAVTDPISQIRNIAGTPRNLMDVLHVRSPAGGPSHH